MSEPYVILSDLHCHDWNSFSKRNEDGLNNRLQITLDEVYRAAQVLKKAGGDRIVLAGDIFHVRGATKPEVLNPVIRLFQELNQEGFDIFAIPGNHDLSTKDSEWLSNAASALESADVRMCHKTSIYSTVYGPQPLVLIPWFSTVESLKAEISKVASDLGKDVKDYDLIIHAPVDNVIPGLPDHGLTDTWLASVGFKRVFSGHYHNHKDFGNGVYSIGATTHQTWGDVGTKAGFLLVHDNAVTHYASHAPQFVDIFGDMDEEELLICDGNYCRVRIGKATPQEISDLKADLIERGAAGVLVLAVKESEIKERATIAKSVTLEQSVNDYVMANYDGDTALAKLCDELLGLAEAV